MTATTTLNPATRWEHTRIDREHLVQLGLWMFLATVTMLFAAFTSAYIVRRAGIDWRPIVLPSVLWLNTLLLGVSSVAAEVGRRAAERQAWRRARLAFAAAILLGLCFLVGQTAGWQGLVSQGVYVMTLPHSSFFYMLTGLHAVHLVVGLIILTVTIPSLASPPSASPARPDAISPAGRARLAATFWHFFGALWVYLFALLALS